MDVSPPLFTKSVRFTRYDRECMEETYRRFHVHSHVPFFFPFTIEKPPNTESKNLKIVSPY